MISYLPGNKRFQQHTGLAILFLLLIVPAIGHGAGSWQFGLREGTTHAQPLFDYNNRYQSAQTGLGRYPRPLYVDILSDREVINFSLCGKTDNDRLQIEIWDEAGDNRLHSSGPVASTISCDNDFTATLPTPYRFAPGAAGTYQLRLYNLDGDRGNGVFERFDVTVSPDNSHISVDPKLDQGRLWSYRWAFYGNGIDADHSTSADLYAVADGGFSDSYYVWQLDLDHFAGYVYEIVANATGLDSPNPDGTAVAGLSACIDTDDDPTDGCGRVSGNRNNVSPLYKIYTGFPARSYPRPTATAGITDFRFLDDAGVDDSFSPSETLSIQDTGDFLFTTNLTTTGTYRIVVDITGDGIYGMGDVILSGLAYPGANSVRWNGFDNSGAVVSNGSYNAAIVLKTGEFHFTAADAETSGGDISDGLTINGVEDDGSLDTGNTVYWDDSTILRLGKADAYNGDGSHRYHNWGDFSFGGAGNLAYIDTYTVGYTSSPVLTRLAVESDDTPRTQLVGTVFHDLNGNGAQDPDEPGFPNITVTLTDDRGDVQQVFTDADGTYKAYTDAASASVRVDVDESMLPSGFVQTAGEDPSVFFPLVAGVENNVGKDGYVEASPAITLRKIATTADYSAVGAVLSYTFTVRNSGNVILYDVVLDDPAAVLSGGPIASLLPGASDSTTFTASYTVSQADVDAGSFTNSATVTGTSPFGSPVSDSASATVSAVPDSSGGNGDGGSITPAEKFPWPLFMAAILPRPCPDEPLYCYIVADRDNETTAVEGSTNSALLKYTFAEKSLELVGHLGVGSVEAMTLSPDGTTLYAVDSNVFGTIDTTESNRSSFVAVNPDGLGAGNGEMGLVEFKDIDGISFDPSSGVLYGTNRLGGSDLLLQIDPATGMFIADAFGPGVDYVIIAGNAEGAVWYDLDDMGIDNNGTMYGIANAQGLDDRLVVIDKNTGDISDPVQLQVEGMPINDMEGFSYYGKDTFYGTTGVETTAGNGEYKNSLFKIEINPVRVEKVVDLDQEFNGYRPYDFEAVACRVCPQREPGQPGR